MVTEAMSDLLPSDSDIPTGDAGTQHPARDGERHSLFMHADLTLSYMSAPQRVRIRNLSKGGVLVETGLPCHVGEDLIIILPNIGAVRGQVAWVMEGRFGVAFEAPVDPNQVRRKVTITTPKEEAYVDLQKRAGRPGFRS